MPVYSEFQSEGDAGQAFNQGQNAGMSMMERAQQMEQRGAQEERQKAIFQAAMPVIQAKNQADLATAHETIQNAVSVQNQRQQILPILAQARTEFHNNQFIPDINERAAANTQWLGKYAQIANIPDYKGEFDTYNHLSTQTTQDQMKIATLANQNDMMSQKLKMSETLMGDKVASSEKIAGLKYQTNLDIANANIASRNLIASGKQGDAAAIQNDMNAINQNLAAGNQGTADTIAQAMQTKYGLKPNQIADSLSKLADGDDRSAAVAKATGNEENFQKYSAKAQLLRTQAEGILSKATTPVTAAPVTATTSQPKNVTPEEYAKIPSGGKYMWNGQEITKK
jgi:hypothetical protein